MRLGYETGELLPNQYFAEELLICAHKTLTDITLWVFLAAPHNFGI